MVSRTGAVQWSRRSLATSSRPSPPWRTSSPRAAATSRCCDCRSRPPARVRDGTPPERPGPAFDTTVVLPLRDADAVALVGRLLAQTGAELLLALPALAEVTIEAGDSAARWPRCAMATP